MNKKLVLGIATVLALTSFESAMAAGLNAGRVRSTVEAEARRAKEKGGIAGINEATPQKAREEVSDRLLAAAKNLVEANELTTAIGRKIKVTEADGKVVEVSVMEIGRQVLGAKKAVSEINRTELNAEGQAHLKAVEEAIEVSSQALALLGKSSEARTNLDAATKKNVDVLNKEISLIPEMLTKMDTRELQSHVEILKLALQEKAKNPDMNGDVAIAKAYELKYKNKAEQKKDETIGCARG